ncbi:MAG: DNA polymerase III subunit gamma/tau [Deltaproteobacteria bacterium]|jgi:DNA polymerase-3 subunit gamma/tau|nr:DNA polymerase III subunit gamma/tau [Deltaproteobacteria bacterium]
MSYLVLARKYRPQTFDDLIGQTQVSRTLTRALETGRVAHAYLFTGPRGVGKTTAARLLAMALSCSGEGPKPCGACPQCLEIQTGQSVDLLEVDGASNRGIDEIRKLREKVKYLPAKNPYKVYIIDEVHALTGDAFNALLKTLEEPPAHVVFIFATTEAHKLPATILSRCQRYDFRRIRVEDIVARLTAVAAAENVTAEKEALTVIARQALGGLRDALGLMDQVIASGGELTLSAVNAALGLINQDLVSRTALAALENRPVEALTAIDEAYNLGFDYRELAVKALELVRDLTMYKASPETASFLDLTDAEEALYREITSEQSLASLHRHFEAWLRIVAELSRHPQPRWLLESHLIRLCHLAPLADLGPLVGRLTAFLDSGAPPPLGSLPSFKTVRSPLAASLFERAQQTLPAASAAFQPPLAATTQATPATTPAPAAPAAFQPPLAATTQTTTATTPAPAAPATFQPPLAATAQATPAIPAVPATPTAVQPPLAATPTAPATQAAPTIPAPPAVPAQQPFLATTPTPPAAPSTPAATPQKPLLAAGAPAPAASAQGPLLAAAAPTAPTPTRGRPRKGAKKSTLTQSLFGDLSSAKDLAGRRDIIEQTEPIQALKQQLPGKFVGYVDVPAASPQLVEEAEPADETDVATTPPDAETAE